MTILTSHPLALLLRSGQPMPVLIAASPTQMLSSNVLTKAVESGFAITEAMMD